jgi:hypothetical protein
MYVHRIYTGCCIGLTNLYFVIISDITLRVRMSSALLLALRHWIYLRLLINPEFVLEWQLKCLFFFAYASLPWWRSFCYAALAPSVGNSSMVEASSKLKLLILFCYYFGGDHVLTWESSSPAETLSSLRLCIVYVTVHVQNINPVDRDIFWLYYARVSRNTRA